MKPITTRIEIFRAGPVRDSAGRDHLFTAEDLTRLAADYNAAPETGTDPVPLVVGHPKADAPAYGWVRRLDMHGPTLVAEVGDVDPKLAAAVRRKAYKKVSASFWPPEHPSNPTPGRLRLRHVGMLGAAAPAVPGLAPVSFVAAEDLIEVEIDFTAPQPKEKDDMAENAAEAALAAERKKIEEERAALEAVRASHEKEVADFAAEKDAFAKQRAEADRAACAAFIEGACAAGKIPAGMKAPMVEFMAALDGAASIDFSAGDSRSPRAFFQDLISAAKPVIDFSSIAVALGEAAGDGGGLTAGQKAEALSKAALEFMAEEASKGRIVDIVTAVRAVEKKGEN